jgi:hypothetical protein
MRRVSTSEDAYVTQNWRALRVGRCFVTLIGDELTATPSLRGADLLTYQPRRSLDARHCVAQAVAMQNTHPQRYSPMAGPFVLLHSPGDTAKSIAVRDLPPGRRGAGLPSFRITLEVFGN